MVQWGDLSQEKAAVLASQNLDAQCELALRVIVQSSARHTHGYDLALLELQQT
jgi:hypothetical protein